MNERLPPLTALRAFDAAARHMSFQRAAAELNVTPAALSFQIKSLEEHFGAPLFKRLNRAVELTEAGRALAPGAAEGFEALTAAWRSARRSIEANVLTVTAGPAFTAKWLAPRMYAFAQAHPEIELRFAAGLRDRRLTTRKMSMSPSVLDTDRMMACIAHAAWNKSGLRRSCCRKLRESTHDFSRRSLLDAPLIHNGSDDFLKPHCDWPAWFQGLMGIDTQAAHCLDVSLSRTMHWMLHWLGRGLCLGRRELL